MPSMGGMGAPRPGRNALGLLPAAPRIAAFRSGSVVLTSGMGIDVEFNDERFKVGIDHDTVVNPDEFTIVTPGRYLLAYQLAFVAVTIGAAGLRRFDALLLVDGVSQVTAGESLLAINLDNNGDSVCLPVTTILDLAAGQVVKMQAVATFGAGAVSLLQQLTFMSMHLLS